ncbi:Ppx/GppA phosphatase family protein [Anaeromicropila herbilytica]|uniref:Exopolyphosphatase n=1 Tax=Anaeromicropila herbilytica TaxID=2785025 RepID=A0A7R7EKC1_9FIRM|nr:exopolyphosphatase [Anaeromicropila herbilytica]BCN30357.1 exopolyphosphatase [Anaeromicropila herbilytica]
MPVTTFAAIDVGSNELSMKIFEFTKKNGIKELEQVRHTIELGSDTYTYGKISHELVEEVCDVLIQFSQKMKEYSVVEYTACATSAIREASNYIMILDQIKLSSNIHVKVLSNSEQRFLCYKAIALHEAEFNRIIEKGTAIVDIGAGSIQISLFDKKSLITTQNIRLGSLRIRELLSDLENKTSNYYSLISEYIDTDMLTFKNLFLDDTKIKTIIAVGDYAGEILRYANQSLPSDTDSIQSDTFETIYSTLLQKPIDGISKLLNLQKEQAVLLLPTFMIYHKMFRETKAEVMWFPGTTLCDALAADYAKKKNFIKPTHNFTDDILSAASNIASRYQCNTVHNKNVEYIALNVFDRIKKLHGLGKRERLLLQIAVILHDCGKFINMNDVSNNSYNIIMSTEIIGISHLERVMIAYMVKYSINNLPSYNAISMSCDKETYLKISKLSAILKIANAMDKSHKQKFSDIQLTLKDNLLVITAKTIRDITLEMGLFESKADYFEEVYGIRPVLKQKRSI